MLAEVLKALLLIIGTAEVCALFEKSLLLIAFYVDTLLGQEFAEVHMRAAKPHNARCAWNQWSIRTTIHQLIQCGIQFLPGQVSRGPKDHDSERHLVALRGRGLTHAHRRSFGSCLTLRETELPLSLCMHHRRGHLSKDINLESLGLTLALCLEARPANLPVVKHLLHGLARVKPGHILVQSHSLLFRMVLSTLEHTLSQHCLRHIEQDEGHVPGIAQ
mmetsp:Transcript_65839/g.129747  ORF Transcript_65839/g.129747 Transcript_65839/m.129747 type:complete len:218 (+) Transcript_65839:1634-2287(+)